jgi:hypothetical protein
MEEMRDFPGLLARLQHLYLSFGAIKLIPPKEWLENFSLFDENSLLLDRKMVTPKYQSGQKLVEGIYRLTNNPLTHVGRQSNKMSLKVNLKLANNVYWFRNI